jgi:hypothetical protein
MLINLATGSVLDEETTENTKTTHPENLALKRGVNMYFSIPMQVEIAHLGILASFVPFLLPKPLCLPIRRAWFRALARARECVVTGLRIMRPSLASFRTVCRELAWVISWVSLGSSQILRFPQLRTDAARRF